MINVVPELHDVRMGRAPIILEDVDLVVTEPARLGDTPRVQTALKPERQIAGLADVPFR